MSYTQDVAGETKAFAGKVASMGAVFARMNLADHKMFTGRIAQLLDEFNEAMFHVAKAAEVSQGTPAADATYKAAKAVQAAADRVGGAYTTLHGYVRPRRIRPEVGESSPLIRAVDAARAEVISAGLFMTRPENEEFAGDALTDLAEGLAAIPRILNTEAIRVETVARTKGEPGTRLARQRLGTTAAQSLYAGRQHIREADRFLFNVVDY